MIDEGFLHDIIIPFAIKLVTALAIFIIGRMIARSLSNLIKKSMERSDVDNMLVNFVGSITYAVLLIAVILAALDQLDVKITSLLAILGAAGLAVGLALKDSLSNFASGVMIIIFRPFKIGDFITAGGSTGVVDEIGLFCTLMHTGDNQRIILPNSAVLGGTIVNTSALPKRRIDMVIGIGYDDNIGEARDIITTVITGHELVLDDPAPGIAVGDLGASSVDLNVRPWVKSGDYWPVRSALLEDIKVALDAAGISIPYPQQDVYMHNVDVSSADTK